MPGLGGVVYNRWMHRLPFFYGWVVAASAGSAMTVRNAAASLTLAIFVLPMSEDLGWSRTAIVGASAVSGIVAMFVLPLVGWLQQRLGSRLLLGGSVVVLGITTMAISWTSSIVVFYLLFGIGRLIFNAPVQIGAASVTAQWFVRRRGRATALLGVMHAVGMGAFPLFAGLFIAANDGDWRSGWLWLGIMVWAVALGPVFGLIRNSPEPYDLRPDGAADLGSAISADSGDSSTTSAADREVQWTLREAMRTPTLWMLAVAVGLMFVIHTGVNIHSAAYLQEKVNLSLTETGGALAVIALGTGIGSIAWGWLADRYQLRLVIAAATLWLAGMALAMLAVVNIWTTFVVVGAFGFGLGGALVLPSVVYANYFGRRSIGAIRGVTEPFVTGGQAVGGIAAGLVYDLTGEFTWVFPALAIAGGCAAVLVLMTRIPVKRVGAEGDVG